MEIKILEMIEGAREASGLTVIIDVFRAFSLECYLMAAGAGRLLPVGKEKTARTLKEEHPDYVLVGERHGVILPGFDYGNSPSQTKHGDIKGKTLIHTTSAGTQGVVNASGADEIITGSLVNASAIARYIQRKNPKTVSLVCMGLEGHASAPEDVLCGRYIESLLKGQPLDMEKELGKLKEDPTVKRFFDPKNQVFPEEDYWMCVDRDRFDFVLRVGQLEEDVFEVTKIMV